MSAEADTLERIVPGLLEEGDEAARDVLRVHVERYEFAALHANPGRLLDIACGVGYGTRMLADRNPALESALGVDLSRDAIERASSEYACERVSYRQADAMHFADVDGFDTIVSLETIEHVDDPVGLIARLVGLLRPGGRLIASVPTTPSVDVNPYHQTDFTEGSFRRILAAHEGAEVDALRQSQTIPLRTILGLDGAEGGERLSRLRPNLPAYYARHPGALAGRIWTTLRYGFTNHYLTVVWDRRA